MKKFILISLACSLFVSCKSDDDNQASPSATILENNNELNEDTSVTDNITENNQNKFLCCAQNYFDSTNINNLNETNLIDSVDNTFKEEAIKTNFQICVDKIVSPNGDGDDVLNIQNILPNYKNYDAQFYNLNDELVYQNKSNTSEFFFNKNQFTSRRLPYGSYRYKIIIENEQTFLQEGYVCLIRELSEAQELMNSQVCDYTNCDGTIDPMISIIANDSLR